MISCIQLKTVSNTVSAVYNTVKTNIKTVFVTFKTVKTNIKTVYILGYQGNDDCEYLTPLKCLTGKGLKRAQHFPTMKSLEK